MNIKTTIIWLLCGLLVSLPLVTKYGNNRPITVGGAIFIVITGPALLPILLIKYMTDTPCLLNCKAGDN